MQKKYFHFFHVISKKHKEKPIDVRLFKTLLKIYNHIAIIGNPKDFFFLIIGEQYEIMNKPITVHHCDESAATVKTKSSFLL